MNLSIASLVLPIYMFDEQFAKKVVLGKWRIMRQPPDVQDSINSTYLPLMLYGGGGTASLSARWPIPKIFMQVFAWLLNLAEASVNRIVMETFKRQIWGTAMEHVKETTPDLWKFDRRHMGNNWNLSLTNNWNESLTDHRIQFLINDTKMVPAQRLSKITE